MRIKSGHIEKFTPFTDCRIPELSKNIILFHGDNEAGKSSLFAFLKYFLFGSSGKKSRKPDVKNCLLDCVDREGKPVKKIPFSDVMLADKFVINLDNFNRTENSKNFEETIKSAYGGVSSIANLQKKIAAECEDLFSSQPQTKNKKINAKLYEIKKKNEEIESQQKKRTSEEYAKLSDELAELEGEVRELQNKDETLNRQKLLASQKSQFDTLTEAKGKLSSKGLETADDIAQWQKYYVELTSTKKNKENKEIVLKTAKEQLREKQQTPCGELTEEETVILLNNLSLTSLNDGCKVAEAARAKAEELDMQLKNQVETYLGELEKFSSDCRTSDFGEAQLTLPGSLLPQYENETKRLNELISVLKEKTTYENLLRETQTHFTAATATRRRNIILAGVGACVFALVGVALFYFHQTMFATAALLIAAFAAVLAVYVTRAANAPSNYETEKYKEKVKELNVSISKLEGDNETPQTAQKSYEDACNAVQSLNDLKQTAENIRRDQARINEEKNKWIEWTKQVENFRQLCTQVQWPTEIKDWPDYCSKTAGRLADIAVKKSEAEQYEKDITALNENIKTLSKDFDALNAQCDETLKQLKCATPAEADAINDACYDMNNSRKNIEEAISTLNIPFDDFIAQMPTLPPSSEIDEQLKKNTATKTDKNKTIGEIQKTLKELASPDALNTLIAEREGLMRELTEEYQRYALVAAKQQILNTALENFKQKEVFFTKLSTIFKTMTNGEWIEIGEDEFGLYFVNKIKPANKRKIEKVIDILSRGAREQLYLAMRLAFAATYLQHADYEAVPIILDDVLVNFDDTRKEATLRAILKDIASDRQQVILFTASEDFTTRARRVLGDTLQTIAVICTNGTATLTDDTQTA